MIDQSMLGGAVPPRTKLVLWSLKALEMQVPYLWGGKDPTERPGSLFVSGGLDCSGFVTYGLQFCGGPDWRVTHSSSTLWRELPAVRLADAQPGDAVFYGGLFASGPVSHVMLYLGAGVVIGQAWGGRDCTSRAYATQRGFHTKALGVGYRKDLVGVARLPIPT